MYNLFYYIGTEDGANLYMVLYMYTLSYYKISMDEKSFIMMLYLYNVHFPIVNVPFMTKKPVL